MQPLLPQATSTFGMYAVVVAGAAAVQHVEVRTVVTMRTVITSVVQTGVAP